MPLAVASEAAVARGSRNMPGEEFRSAVEMQVSPVAAVRIETERLGYPDTDPKMLIPLANKLVRLNVRLERGGSAT